MPNFVVLGCLEVGEKFTVVGWWGGVVEGISTPTTELHKVKLLKGHNQINCF